MIEAEKNIEEDLKEVLTRAGAEEYIPVFSLKKIKLKQLLYMKDIELAEEVSAIIDPHGRPTVTASGDHNFQMYLVPNKTNFQVKEMFAAWLRGSMMTPISFEIIYGYINQISVSAWHPQYLHATENPSHSQ